MKKLFSYIFVIFLLQVVFVYNTAYANVDGHSLHWFGSLIIKSTMPLLFIFLLYFFIPTPPTSTFVKSKSKKFIFTAYFLIYSSIIYVSTIFGRIEEGVLGALVNTNPNETVEFLSGLDIPIFIYSITLTSLILLFANKLYCEFSKLKIKKIFFIIPYLSCITVFYLIGWNTVKIVRQDSGLSGYLIYKIFTKKGSNLNIIDKWKNIKLINKNSADVDIIIIGESGRRDRFSMYGYKKPTTQPIDDYPGLIKFQKGLSPATHTEESVPNILTMNGDLRLNVVDLAKDAGYETFWISNQGSGISSTSKVDAIANLSDVTHFMSYSWTKAVNDFEMIPIIKKYVLSDTNKKVIFVHLIGSHYSFCKRIINFKHKIKVTKARTVEEKDNDCYDNSILKTAYFIRNILDFLNSQNFNYNVTFFSDHGLIRSAYSPYLIHAPNTNNLDAKDVPFFIFRKNVHSENIPCTFKLHDFYLTFSELLGIKGEQLVSKKNECLLNIKNL